MPAAAPARRVERTQHSGAVEQPIEAGTEALAAELDHEVADEREELHEMPVTVDDRMIEPGPDRVRRP